MARCNFEASMCQICASAGTNFCPLENNRTIRELKDEIENLEVRLVELERRIRRFRDRK